MPDAPHPVDFLVYGANGFLGSHFVRTLSADGRSTFAAPSSDILDRSAVSRDLDAYRPRWVFCAAGLSGNPNIDWFETHRQEGVRINVLATLNVVDLCHMRNVHVTILGSGLVYQYDERHPLGSGAGFKETEPPNVQDGTYIKLRILLEQLLEMYTNVLHVRICYPISSAPHAKNLLSKLLRFKEIVSVPTSVTVIDELWPILLDMCRRNLVGNFNFANPGVIENREILELYKEHVDPRIEWRCASSGPNGGVARRPFAELDVSKLLSEVGGEGISQVKEGVKKVMKSIRRPFLESD
ncbi:uncharacterized protein LOC126317482 [Schistocerca gregaria]|uniref:uncharacterized protein LOC126317482 n=1 Tax=Schistocerca gregaria TaxID=7010 RepID=UPI00211E3B62|nr:uncharacterized protein LOC126317482 [Schistocerca gregaria]